MLTYIWKLASLKYDKSNKNWLLDLLAKHRGLTTKQKLDQFLNPSIKDIENVKLSDLSKGIERVVEAIHEKEKIIVYSDYDADGLNAAAIMWETLYDLGADVLPYVPHRIKEGYGLSNSAIKELGQNGAQLIITVDHGVTAVKQVDYATSLGVDVVITDHHVLPENLPKAVALVHSTETCGAGVAFRFCLDLVRKIKPAYEKTLENKLELAAIATIADLVPLLGANRAIVKLGLEKINKTTRPGLLSLIRESGVKSPITAYDVSHIIAPRINAMGRIEHGLEALRLLCTQSREVAEKLAKKVAKTNVKRQDLTVKAIDTAITMVDKDHLVGVISHADWHEGIIGLVASRLVERHHKPIIVVSIGEARSKGSARSIPGFNIVEAIRSASEYLVDAGGHPMAAGFTIETKYLEAFTKKINVYAAGKLTEELSTPYVNVECKLDRVDINMDTLEVIKTFEPYGMGNPQPTFLTKGLMVEDVRGVGPDNKHLKLLLEGINTIGFNMGERKAEIRPGYAVDIVYTIQVDNYNSRTGFQLKLKDLLVKN